MDRNFANSKKKKITDNRVAIKPKVINERLPNDNLYKNDVRYQMNFDLNFESTIDQDNAHRDINLRFEDFIKYAIPLLYLNKIFFSFSTFFSVILSIVSCGAFLGCIFILWLIKSKESSNFIPLNNKYLILTILLQSIELIFIIFKLDHDCDEIIFQLFWIMVPYFFISIGLDNSIIKYFSISTLHLAVFLTQNGFSQKRFYTRFFMNIFSKKFLTCGIIMLILIFLHYFVKKSINEMWALYDSFKRSFFTFKKCLYDDFPYPIIIFLKKNNRQIFYKNSKADTLIQKVKKLKASNAENTTNKKTPTIGKSSTPTFPRRIIQKSSTPMRKEENLEEIFFDKEIQIMFETELDKCINNKKKFFDFPMRISNDNCLNLNYHRSSKNVTFFEGDMHNFEWYRIVVSSCFWKNQEAVYIQMIKNDDFHGNDLIINYMSKICDQLKLVTDNIDRSCDRVIDSELPDSKKEKFSQASNTSSMTLPRQKISGKSNASPPKPDSSNIRKGNFNRQQTITKSGLTNVNVFLGPFTPLPPKFDFSIWFFLKYNTTFIYDLFLTVKIYDSIVNRRLLSYNYKIILPEFFLYLEDYLKIPCQLKNFKFIFVNNSIEDELVVCFQYFRVIVFNILLFILNNSENESEEKIVEVIFRSEKEFTGEDYKIKFSIKYKDENLKINYNDVTKILRNPHKGFINCKVDSSKIKLLDIGIMTVYHILNQVFENDLIMTSENNQHSISFYMMGKYQRKNIGNPTDNYPIMKFLRPNIRISEQYYLKILNKIYNFTPVIMDRKSSQKLNLFTNQPEYKFSFNDKKSFYVKQKEEQTEEVESDNSNDRLQPEEINFKLSDDRDLVNKVNIQLSKHFENYDKLINTCKLSIINQIPNMKKKCLKLNSMSVNVLIENHKVRFEEGGASNVKYFYPPRFLIVEDNAFGRINLIDILKKQKLDYLIDISAYGWESVQKFKFFLNKGYMYDIIFMDINLLDMLGSEAARVMRDYERQYTTRRTNIVAVSVEGKKNIKCDQTFDGYFEKPIKSEEFTEYICRHFTKNRPDIKI